MVENTRPFLIQLTRQLEFMNMPEPDSYTYLCEYPVESKANESLRRLNTIFGGEGTDEIVK